MKRVSIITISALLAIGVLSCKQQPVEEAVAADTENSEKTTQTVRTIPLEMQTIKRTVKVTASLAAVEETYLAPAISGKIKSIDVDVDDEVKKGQPLVHMDETQLQQTRVQYANLKKDLARMDTLLDYGSMTQQSYDQMETQVSVTGVMLENLQENTVLRAPYNGVITGKYFNDGELFSPAPNTQAGKAAIVSLVKMDKLKVYINLSETYMPLLRKGQVATILTDVYPKGSFEATVFRLYPTINPQTRTFTVELRMDNPGYKLRPGMYSTVTLELGDREALLVPAIAVLKQPGTNNKYVYVNDNGIGRKKMVEIGERLDDQLELLTNGIQPGDELIYAGHVNLMDGETIEVIED